MSWKRSLLIFPPGYAERRGQSKRVWVVLLLVFVTVGVVVTGVIGYLKLQSVTEENARIRIDRAARACQSSSR